MQKKKHQKAAVKNLVPVKELVTKTSQAAKISKIDSTVYVTNDRMRVSLGGGDESDDDLSYHQKYMKYSKSESALDTLSNSSPSNSFRSLDGFSLESDFSLASKLSTKEMIAKMELRASKGLGAPDYVPRLNELDPSLLSWNKKMPVGFDKNKPPINIIPCMHPIELILAKADKRMRKRRKTQKRREIKCQEKIEELNKTIEHKFSRAERYAAILAHKQRQIIWLKILSITHFIKHVHPLFVHKYEVWHRMQKLAKSALVIKRTIMRWYHRHIFRKVTRSFLKMLNKQESRFRLHMRIHRKRTAVLRIKTFLTEYKGHHKMNIVVHKYLEGVRKVQRCIRDFLACKRGKIIALQKIWDKMELRYIKKMLDKRKALKKSTFKIPVSEDPSVEIDSKSKIEIKNQSKLWAKIDVLMEGKIKQLKESGIIQEEKEEDCINKLRLPPEQSGTFLATLIERLRKDFYTSQKAMIRKQIDMESTFQEFHANDLLHGRTGDINRIINEKFDKKLISLKYKPFTLFQFVSNKMIYDKVKEAHRLNETFKIKIDESNNNNNKMKSVKSQKRMSINVF